MQVVIVGPASLHLPAVKALWRRESKWLGFFPAGAFEDAARAGRIVAAVGEDQFLGYVLYRLSRGRVMITHLVISPTGRGRGAARALVEHLGRNHPLASGIGLSCRRDYPANGYWPKVGFVASHEREGRSREGFVLTFWWRDHGLPGLFSQTPNAPEGGETVAAVDANVFYDLVDSNRPQGRESLSLRADWLVDEVSLCVTDEIRNDIDRDPDVARRKSHRQALAHYPTIGAGRPAVEAKRALLRGLFPQELDPQTTSDLEHVARTAAAGVTYFLTRDGPLLALSAAIEEAVGVVVIAPTEFINRVDQLRREASYRPVRVAGGVVQLVLVRGEEVDELSKAFTSRAAGGGDVNLLRRRLRELMCRPDEFSCQVARAEDGTPLALVAHTVGPDPTVFGVDLFLVRAGAAAETVARYLLHRLILTAAGQGRRLIRLAAGVRDPVVRRAATAEYGFELRGSGDLVKYCRRVVDCGQQIAADLWDLTAAAAPAEGCAGLRAAGQVLHSLAATGNPHSAAALEGGLWPAKLDGAPLPTFLLPIRPSWAERLFDEGLADQSLFGVERGRLMAREGVYYRAASRAGLSAPARVLWYVSGGRAFPGSASVRACSAVEEIVVGPATEVYARFRRLGVYRWDDVLGLAKGVPTASIMALRFVNTEPFSRPVSYRRLAGYGVRGSVQGPTRITPAAFTDLYRAGMNL